MICPGSYTKSKSGSSEIQIRVPLTPNVMPYFCFFVLFCSVLFPEQDIVLSFNWLLVLLCLADATAIVGRQRPYLIAPHLLKATACRLNIVS